MEFAALRGNDHLKQQLARRERSGQLPHACIIAGPDPAGRRALAGTLAAAMVCAAPPGRRPCGTCLPCKKAAQGIHPDITAAAGAKEGRPIAVDQVRALRADAYIRPNEGERKVYLLEGADQMNAAAQNAMLKLLEEGPPYAAFLLLAGNPGALLETVRSRCEVFSLEEGDTPRPSDPRAEELADAVEHGTEQALFAASMALDSGKKEELLPLLEGLEEALCRRLSARPGRRLLRAVELVRELEESARLNVNPGQLAGWLCAGMFIEGENL